MSARFVLLLFAGSLPALAGAAAADKLRLAQVTIEAEGVGISGEVQTTLTVAP